jgi:hypothetical protein
MLFRVPLMTGGGEPAAIARWRGLVEALSPQQRSDLGQIALVFAELAGCYLAWEKGLEDLEMTESQVVNRWIERAQLQSAREYLPRALENRFPGQVPAEVTETINQQPSEAMLKRWFGQAMTAVTLADFIAVLRA